MNRTDKLFNKSTISVYSFSDFYFIYSVDIVIFSLTTRGNNKIITSYNFSRMDVNFNSGFSKQTFITVAT